jgi:hypothetical protein
VWRFWVFVDGFVLLLRLLCNCVFVAAQLAENWFCMVVLSVVWMVVCLCLC